MKAVFIVIGGFILSFNTHAATKHAKAKLESRSGSKVTGTVAFEQTDSELEINYDVKGLKPNSTFGFHVHEKGDCSSADAKSAGPHYHKVSDIGGTSSDNPEQYAGDLPQIKSDAKGVAQGSITTTKISLNKTNAINGRAIMVHGGPDDINKPSAPRVACGVIK